MAIRKHRSTNEPGRGLQSPLKYRRSAAPPVAKPSPSSQSKGTSGRGGKHQHQATLHVTRSRETGTCFSGLRIIGSFCLSLCLVVSLTSPPLPPFSSLAIRSSPFLKYNISDRPARRSTRTSLRPAQAALYGSRRSQPLAGRARFGIPPRFKRTCAVYRMISVRFLSPLHLDFALHSQIIISILTALALDVVHPTTVQFH